MLDMPPRRFNIVNMLRIAGKLITSLMYLEIFDKTHGRDLCKIPPKSPKFPPRHLGDFSWAPSSSKPHKPWLPNTSTASRYWSWIKWLIGSRSNSTWIVKEPVTFETTAAVPPIPCYPCSKPSCSDNDTASPIPNSNTASSPASTSTCFAALTSWVSPITAPYAATATGGARRHPVRTAGTD